MPDTPRWVALYLAAIVAANLLVAQFGPAVAVLNAFWLIGLDLSLRDILHERWADDQLVLRMGLLIATGGVVSYVLNRPRSPSPLPRRSMPRSTLSYGPAGRALRR